ncbi:MAG: transporter substrate-binding domain-containing protein [Clostridia bacterium]|nr:transporter substrate-binding domain-containing protein [Clostridia bacterium]MBQ2462228.1 transporter substrate-binding domain-containing protein [Clostridia bacterium]MBQ9289818.1 transporter substrate-binding domain-containing protein [Clostridia bacterium]MBR0216445.1 transporter substrate-binding domain-containing protein [Clostridia bacterium]
MKKMLALVFSLVMAMTILVASVSSAETADLLSQIKERGYIIIATEGDWAPWTYHDESNQLVGLDVEIGTAIAERLGVEARFEETNWDSILQGVDSGRFDLACNGVGYTETRAEKYSFSTPYVYTHKVLVVRKDNEEIKSFEDLKGKKTANTASSTYAAIAEEYGATVTGVDALADTLQLVLQRRVDATINSQVTINDYMIAHPEAEIKVVDEGPGEPVAIPVRKADDTATLIAAINEALDAMRADGTLAAISIKYFNGLDLTGMPQE